MKTATVLALAAVALPGEWEKRERGLFPQVDQDGKLTRD